MIIIWNTLRAPLTRYTILFLIFSFIGWLYEVALAFIYGWGFVNRGFLLGPCLPIYGFGLVALSLMLTNVMKKRLYLWKIPVTPVVVFLLIVLISSAIEYAAGVLLELLFHKRWWDYIRYPLNINGRICLSASLRFGAGGMLFLYIFTPLLDRLLNRFSQAWREAAAGSIAAVLAVDFVCTMLLR